LSQPRAAVFLGPSCSEPEARRHLPDADYLPPAARGSFYNIINDGYDTIVLIDGLFYAHFSVWHKEIMFALDSGIRVIGASSMGALRAAELVGTGIVGVGEIFEWYRDGIIDGDDEVALLHEGREEGFTALTLPLVNLRWNLRRAAEHGVIEDAQGRAVIESARRLCFVDRTLERILDPLARQIDVAALTGWLERNSEDLKKIDAIQALALAAEAAPRPRAAAPLLRHYEALHVNVGIEYFRAERLTSISAKTGERETPLSAYLAGVDVDDPGYGAYLRARRYHRLIVGWARELRLEPADTDSSAVGADRRRETGLTLIDLARERRDDDVCEAMQQRFCGDDKAGLIRALSRELQGQAFAPPFDAGALISLDGRLVYTLWALGLRKGLARSLLAADPQAPEDPPESIEAILAFAGHIDRLGPSLFGYTFDPACEILAAHQRLDRLDALEPVLA
jgi:hypothetical protein